MKNLYPLLLFLGSALLLVLGSLAASVLVLRAHLLYGSQFTTTWTEELSIYATWKVAHGYPAYEWPVKDWYALSMYNWLFYDLYGIVARLSHAEGMHAAQIQRALTFLFGLAGCALTYALTRHLVRNFALTPNRLILASGSLLLWFSWGGMLFDAFTVRPDFAAQALSLAGLGVFLWAMRQSATGFLLSALLFYLAWAMKQSVVFSFAACLLYLVLALQWRSLLPFAGTFLLLTAVTLVAGGEVYRYNILYAPSISPIDWHHRLQTLYMVVLHSLCFLGLIVYVPLLFGRLQLRVTDWKSIGSLPLAPRQILVFLLAVLLSGIANFITLGKLGSDVNAAFDFLVLMAILAMVCLHHLLQTASPRRDAWLVYLSLLFLISALVPIKNILFYPSKFGVTPVITRNEYAEKVRYGEWLKTLPAPLLIRDAIFTLPWYSNQGHYPAVVPDFCWYPTAESLGLLADGGIPSLIKKRYFASLLLPVQDELLPIAHAAGYQEVTLPPDHLYYQNSMIPGQVGPVVLLIRPPP